MKKKKVIIKVSGVRKKEKLTLEEEKRRLLWVRKLLFNKLVDGERENVMVRLRMRLSGLRLEDLEEVYDDGCLVLWEKMMDKDFELRENSIVGYLVKICWNIGMHYLRKMNVDVLSLDMMMKNGFGGDDDVENGLEEMFEVLSEKENNEEKYKKLEKVWKRLKDVERMILESFYVEGCRMDEIARRIGYKNGDSVKSKKNKVLRKMMKMMSEERADKMNLPLVA